MNKTSDCVYVPALRYHWLTPYYDVIVGITTRERTFKQALIAQARIAPGHQVLDLATGTGTLAIWTKQQQPQSNVIGADGDPSILLLATQKALKAGIAVKFDQAMSYELPYPDASFDRVLTSLFFHHLTWASKEQTVQEILRVLKPGGELHVADWGRADNVLMRILFWSVQILDGFRNTQENVSGRLIPLFETAGLTQVAQRQTFSTIFGTMALYSAVKPAY